MLLPFKVSGATTEKALLYQTNFESFFPEVNTNTNWCALKPYIEQAIEDYLIPYLGEPLYDDLMTKYHADEVLTSSQARVLRSIQICVAWYSVAYAYTNKLDILADIGNVQLTADKAPPTPQWVFNKKYGNLLRTADRKMDNLLEYLEKQADLKSEYYKLWYLDEAYTRGKADLFHCTSELQTFHNILSSRRTFLALCPALRDAARMYIIPAIGLPMYNELVKQHNIAKMSPQNIVLMEYVRAALAKLAIGIALDTQSITLEADGVRAVSSELGLDKITLEKTMLQAKNCKDMGLQYLEQLVNFISVNGAQYPTFAQNQNYLNNPIIVSEPQGAILIKSFRK